MESVMRKEGDSVAMDKNIMYASAHQYHKRGHTAADFRKAAKGMAEMQFWGTHELLKDMASILDEIERGDKKSA